MRPIAVFRHAPSEGPGYFASFLESKALPWHLIAIDAGDKVPTDASAYAGLVFMGGPMSVNDDLPWIAAVLKLIQQAVAQDIPVLGHCLGGQLMARALGGVVSRNPVKEIGWGTVRTVPGPIATHWLGDIREFQAFHWHGETFSIPAGASRILESAHCANQGFALGKHLALQCHVEMTESMIQEWCALGADEIAAADSPAVQSPEQIMAASPTLLAPLHSVAERLYTRWIEGLRR